MLSMHIYYYAPLATLPYRSIVLCLDMQCSAQDCKRALLFAELHFEGTFACIDTHQLHYIPLHHFMI